jgi:amino acid adenylation domain-containing protein
VQRFRGSRFKLPMPDAVSKLKSLGRSWGATPFMVLLALFKLLLSRFSGQLDIAVGSPMAGRSRQETEAMIGFFVNMVVLRTALVGDPIFGDLVARVRRVTTDGLAHQSVPFEKLVQALEPRRDTSRNPLFQVAFILLTVNPVAEALPGIEMSDIPLGTRTAKFDLSFYFIDAFADPRLTLEYASDLFDESTARRLGAAFRQLLIEAAARPEAKLSELATLNLAERQQLLREWQAGSTAASAGESILQLFAQRVREQPAAEAVVWREERLSYGELHRRASLLARRLRRLGVGAEQPVGVTLERTPELVVALLAVLAAGGAYVALDPSYPTERLDFMAKDSGVRIVITRRELLARLPTTQIESLCLDDETFDEDAGGERTGVESQVPLRAGNLAYLLYTSGSTGRPKGVAISHGAARALAEWAREVFDPPQLSGVLASTSINFDLSVFEIFVPLAWGGRVVLAEHALDLATLPPTHEVTLVNTVPSALAQLLRESSLPAAVQTVNLAGEPIPPELVGRLFAARPGLRLMNLYGPSEDTTYSTFAEIRSADRNPPIGRPITGSSACLFDRHLRPVPLGAIGELHLAGAGLARGYHGRPRLTAERFLPNPEDGRGGRLYRTGDLARHLPDGRLEFLGRADQQVKIRGFRIELGEIEAALGAHPQVRRAIVAARGEGPARELVAFCVADSTSALPEPEALRAFLLRTLPTFMVPAAFVELDRLPTTPSGKVDRRALDRLGAEARHLQAAYVAPENDLEEEISEIWRELLDLERIGVQDNFFDLGGNSMLIAQMNLRLQQRLGRTLPILTLFNYPTTRALARHLAEEASPAAVERRPEDRAGALGEAKDRLRRLRREPAGKLEGTPT